MESWRILRPAPAAALLLGLFACGGSTPTAPSIPGATPAPTAAPTPTPAPTPGPGASPTPAPTAPPGPTVLRRATLRGAHGHSCSGTAAIVQDGRTFTLELRSDFRIDTGSIDVVLSNDPDSIDGGLNLGDLKSMRGAQSYPMPNDGAAYRYLVLWCRPFRVPIGLGELR